MEIAQTVKKNLASIGYRTNVRPFHREQLWILLERLISFLLQLMYLLEEAKTPKQYMQSYFTLCVAILMYISLASTIIEMPTIFIFIGDMEKVINEREFLFTLSNSHIYCYQSHTIIILGSKYPKSKTMYKKANQLAEQLSKLANFALVYVSVPVILFPKAIMSYFIYYTTDTGPSAFEVSFSVW